MDAKTRCRGVASRLVSLDDKLSVGCRVNVHILQAEVIGNASRARKCVVVGVLVVAAIEKGNRFD